MYLSFFYPLLYSTCLLTLTFCFRTCCSSVFHPPIVTFQHSHIPPLFSRHCFWITVIFLRIIYKVLIELLFSVMVLLSFKLFFAYFIFKNRFILSNILSSHFDVFLNTVKANSMAGEHQQMPQLHFPSKWQKCESTLGNLIHDCR